MGPFVKMLLVLVAVLTSTVAQSQITFNTTEFSVLLDSFEIVNVTFNSEKTSDTVNLFFNVSGDGGMLDVSPQKADLTPVIPTLLLNVSGLSPGHDTINVFVDNLKSEFFLHVTVLHSFEWEIFSEVIGWLYFVAWSLSFYPQTYLNWKRKSVVGLNFDFTALNVVGFLLYSLYNGCLFWVPDIQDQYFEEHPGGLLPVLANDIFFSFHAFVLCTVTVVQCLMYERGGQTVSLVAKLLCGVFATFIVISAICAAADALSWLRFLEFCSYVKLSITLIKYIPQAYMNFRRKSTDGWSIGNVLLDFTGGVLSMGQMLVNAWNYDDWSSIFGDPTKFGLGLFSVLFDILFIVQHYILYRHGSSSAYADFPGSIVNSRSELVR